MIMFLPVAKSHFCAIYVLYLLFVWNSNVEKDLSIILVLLYILFVAYNFILWPQNVIMILTN